MLIKMFTEVNLKKDGLNKISNIRYLYMTKSGIINCKRSLCVKKKKNLEELKSQVAGRS